MSPVRRVGTCLLTWQVKQRFVVRLLEILGVASLAASCDAFGPDTPGVSVYVKMLEPDFAVLVVSSNYIGGDFGLCYGIATSNQNCVEGHPSIARDDPRSDSFVLEALRARTTYRYRGTVDVGSRGRSESAEQTFTTGTEEISNKADDFFYQLTNIVWSYVRGRDFTWQNTGPRAEVSQASRIKSGSVSAATLDIRDAAGSVVYNGSLDQTGTFQTAVGVAGNWRIQITAQHPISGTINFRVMRRP